MHNIDVRQSRVEQIPGLWQEDQFSEHLLSIGWCGRRSCDAQECTVGGGRVGGKGEGGWEWEREERVGLVSWLLLNTMHTLLPLFDSCVKTEALENPCRRSQTWQKLSFILHTPLLLTSHPHTLSLSTLHTLHTHTHTFFLGGREPWLGVVRADWHSRGADGGGEPTPLAWEGTRGREGGRED